MISSFTEKVRDNQLKSVCCISTRWCVLARCLADRPWPRTFQESLPCLTIVFLLAFGLGNKHSYKREKLSGGEVRGNDSPVLRSLRWHAAVGTKCLCHDTSAGPPSSPPPYLWTHDPITTQLCEPARTHKVIPSYPTLHFHRSKSRILKTLPTNLKNENCRKKARLRLQKCTWVWSSPGSDCNSKTLKWCCWNVLSSCSGAYKRGASAVTAFRTPLRDIIRHRHAVRWTFVYSLAFGSGDVCTVKIFGRINMISSWRDNQSCSNGYMRVFTWLKV